MDFTKFLPNNEPPRDLYWSLVLEPTWIQAGIWEVADSKAKIISMGPVTHWETQEEFVEKVDTALSSAIQQLPEDTAEPSKTIFGVVSSWTIGGQIKPEYLSVIKEVCDKLALTPQGFVVLPEAIAHLVKTEEGSPINAIILGVTNEEIEMSVFRLGNLIGTTQISRSVSVLEDVIEGLSRFNSLDPLPSRFILYDGKGKDLEEIEQILVLSDWDSYQNVKFLHTPKIEIIQPDRKVLAVALAGGAEMAGITGVEIADFPGKEEITSQDKMPEGTQNVSSPVDLEKVGFVLDEDIAKSDEYRQENQIRFPLKVEEEQTAFVQDNLNKQTFAPSHVIHTPQIEATNEGFKAGPVRQNPFNKLTSNLKLGVGGFVNKIGQAGVNRPAAIRKPLMTFTPGLVSKFSFKRIALALFVLVALGLGIGFAAWWFLPKATVTIYVSPQKLEDKISFTIDTQGGQTDFSKDILSGKAIKVSQSGEKSRSTTGTKTVGERAKGSLQIRNGTASAIRLPAGTTVISSSSLEFTLDTSASVSGALSPASPGTANALVTAKSIGSEYNLAKDESFKVSNYPKSEVDAISLSDLSGGSSRQISSVSSSDQKDLETSLKAELTQSAEKDLASKITDAQYFIKGAMLVETGTKTFSNKVGDEASNLNLNMSVDASGVVVDKSTVFEYLREKLKGRVPQGFVLRDEQIDLSFDLVTNSSGKFELSAVVSANLLPEIKPDDIAQKLAGKYPNLARKYLTTIPGFTRAEIKLKPNFPGRLGTLPWIKKNISIEVSAN